MADMEVVMALLNTVYEKNGTIEMGDDALWKSTVEQISQIVDLHDRADFNDRVDVFVTESICF